MLGRPPPVTAALYLADIGQVASFLGFGSIFAGVLADEFLFDGLLD